MERIHTTKLFDAIAIAKNGSATSVAVCLEDICPNGVFSVQSTMAGTGTLKLEYLISSTLNGTYVAGGTAIVAAQGAGTNLFYTLDPTLAPFIKIKATENDVNPITSLDLWLNIQ